MFQDLANSVQRLGEGVASSISSLTQLQAGVDAHALRVDHWMSNVSLSGAEALDSLAHTTSSLIAGVYQDTQLNAALGMDHLRGTLGNLNNSIGETVSALRQPAATLAQGTDIALGSLALVSFGPRLFHKVLELAGLADEKDFALAA
jgi:hypothetical protein